jgi:hypothetical protein
MLNVISNVWYTILNFCKFVVCTHAHIYTQRKGKKRIRGKGNLKMKGEKKSL